MEGDELATRVARLESRQQIDELIARYANTFDDRDLDGLVDCFSGAGTLTANGRVVVGSAALREYFAGRFRELGPTIHTPHRRVVEWIADDRAHGVVNGHAELMVAGCLVVVAHRYEDEFLLERERWRFASRHSKVFDAQPWEDVGNVGRDELRRRWPGGPPTRADLPEVSETWQRFHERGA